VLTRGAPQGNIIKGRLEAIQKGGASNKPALDLNLIRDELFSSIPTLHRLLQRWTWPTRLRELGAQAGMEVRPGKLLLLGTLLGVAAFQAIDYLYGQLLLSMAVALLAASSPLGYIFFKRSRRLHAFEKGFPEVIELLSRSVRAGHSFTTGLEMVATDLPEPVSGEFRIAFDEQRFGLPLRDALLNLCARVPLLDLRLFVIALLVQKETGGNLAEILDNLAHVIRERVRIAGEVRVRTAQGRLTALILIVLPLAMLGLLWVVNPDYISLLFNDPWGVYMLSAAAALQVIGAFLLWKIVKIRV